MAERGPASESEISPAARARQECYRLLTLAPRTRAQLADALAKRGIPEDVADDVLAKFTDAGLIDDAAFAKAWVESRHQGRGLASRALRAELKNRGVATDDIQDALEELDAGSEAETARRLVDRKLASMTNLSPEAKTRRLAGLLARKGYPPGLAFRVVREAMEAEGLDVVTDDVLSD
ncbi:MAG: regulatory protein RecX [Streptosporangiaceae bacterium]|jgi:regulatory protein